MFDARFYQTVLPETVQQRCDAQPEHVPVVELHLPDGTTLDLCCIATLADTWLSVIYFRDLAQGDAVDQAFLPYPLVQWVTVSVHPPHARHIGFDVARSAAAALVIPSAATTPVPMPPASAPPTPTA